MQAKVNEWVDKFPSFHSKPPTEQIVRLVFFHTVELARETISRDELTRYFELAGLPIPKNLPQILSYLSGSGRRLIKNASEYSLRRELRSSIEDELRALAGSPPPVHLYGVQTFDFPGKNISDHKIKTLLSEANRCYATECWNACGILVRTVLERTLDSISPSIRAANGLRDKLNYCISNPGNLSKTTVEGLKELKAAKLIGDIVAHHSAILLDKHEINLVIGPFRILLKEVSTI
jgi:hypothetical protein